MPEISHNTQQLHIVTHPLIEHKMTLLRDKNTTTYNFRHLVFEITLLLGFAATQQLTQIKHDVVTPTEETYHGKLIASTNPVIIPILRAGIPMADGLLALLPDAKVGHIGLARDEATHEPSCYYFKIPADSAKRAIFLCDPMLATGGSAIHAVTLLKETGIKDITLMCLIAAPEGVDKFTSAHPDVPVYIAALDRELNNHAFILPGLGDAGDRVCGTTG